jgi:hypothetical protein
LTKQPLRRESLAHWRPGVYAAVLFTAISLLPQLNFWRVRGRNWHGAFYTYHPDETPYAAYVNSLIESRPRRNDPYSGRIDGSDGTLPESLMSIQFVPAYSLALPARWLGLSAMTIFLFLTPLVSVASVLAIFWLIRSLTNDSRIAATGALFVLGMGGLARGQFFVRKLGGIATPYVYMPFERRYEPAFAFPLFFIFLGLVWLMLRSKDRRTELVATFFAAFVFSVLVFSYYFLWTAAAALILSVGLVLAINRTENWRQVLRRLAQLGVLMALPLVPYVYLLLHRATSIDAEQGLTFTHAADLFRPPALIGALLLLMLCLAVRLRRIARTDPMLKFAAAFALAPLIMFNQQVVTGRSLQPIHYEQFIANYVSLVAVVLTGRVLWGAFKPDRQIPALLLILVSVISTARAFQEAWLGARSKLTFSTIVDDSRPVGLRLAALARSPASVAHPRSDVVLVVSSVSFVVSDTLPITAPQPVLWAPHMFSFAGVEPRENRERFYQQLYYSGVNQQTLRADTLDRTYFRLANFGWARVIQGLNANWQPITDAEEQAALADYQHYVDTFDAKRTAMPPLAFVVTPANVTADLSRVDRWYERDPGEQVGAYVIYRTRLRP